MAIADKENGYIKTMWCGDEACEELMKEKSVCPAAACL